MIEEIHIEDRADTTAIAGLVAAVVGEDPLLGHAPFFQEVILRDTAVNMIPRFTFVEVADARCILVASIPHSRKLSIQTSKWKNSVQLS